MKLKNSNCDETQTLILWGNSKSLIVMKLKNANCNETQKLKLWRKSKSQIVTKNLSKPWQPMRCSLGRGQSSSRNVRDFVCCMLSSSNLFHALSFALRSYDQLLGLSLVTLKRCVPGYFCYKNKPVAHTAVWSQWKVNLLEPKCPALHILKFCYQGLTLKNEQMTLSRTLRIMYDQRLTKASRPIWSPGLIDLNLKSL